MCLIKFIDKLKRYIHLIAHKKESETMKLLIVAIILIVGYNFVVDAAKITLLFDGNIVDDKGQLIRGTKNIHEISTKLLTIEKLLISINIQTMFDLLIFQLTGSYLANDVIVSLPMINDMSPEPMKLFENYVPHYDKLETSLISSNATGLKEVYEKFYAWDTEAAKITTDPKLKEANSKYAEGMWQVAQSAIDEINKTGKLNLVEFNKNHKIWIDFTRKASEELSNKSK